MDNSSNTSFQLRLSSLTLNNFKIACERNQVKPSQVVREFIQNYSETKLTPMVNSAENELTTETLKSHIYTIAEAYCGPGGIAVGAKNSSVISRNQKFSFEHKWATDYHSDTCRTYAKNIFGDENSDKVICADIRKLNLKKLSYADGFLYGFPCNDFSNVGESKGLQGEFGPLYRYGVDYINQCNPKFIFAENVSGISNANSGFAFKKILSELSNAGEHGYNLTAHLYRFEEYSVPQARHRFIVVGFRNDLGLSFKVPAPSKKLVSAKEALEKPKIPLAAKNQELTKQAHQVVERLKHIKPGENAWTADLPEHLKLNVKGAKLSMIYKRLDPDKPAYTVTGSGGGGTHVYHWSEPRALTNRERARLQTFPDDFVFIGSKESVRRQIGMAVPVKGAQIILEAILKTLANKSYPYVEPNLDIKKLLDEF
jgi:DNA (cytosine-5)-methyltransferase 1